MSKPGFLQKLLGGLKGNATGNPGQEETLPEVRQVRRKLVTASVVGVLGVNFLMFLRFFFPRALYEPKKLFDVGYPSDYGFGVDEKYKQSDRVWIVRNAEGIFAIHAVCTHLGCTPNWLPSEGKFKCPCHGSGFRRSGINFEGPAPRPLERIKIGFSDDGQLVVDKSVKFRYELGEWDKRGATLKV